MSTLFFSPTISFSLPELNHAWKDLHAFSNVLFLIAEVANHFIAVLIHRLLKLLKRRQLESSFTTRTTSLSWTEITCEARYLEKREKTMQDKSSQIVFCWMKPLLVNFFRRGGCMTWESHLRRRGEMKGNGSNNHLSAHWLPIRRF